MANEEIFKTIFQSPSLLSQQTGVDCFKVVHLCSSYPRPLSINTISLPYIRVAISRFSCNTRTLNSAPFRSPQQLSSHFLICFHTQPSPYLYHSPYIKPVVWSQRKKIMALASASPFLNLGPLSLILPQTPQGKSKQGQKSGCKNTPHLMLIFNFLPSMKLNYYL